MARFLHGSKPLTLSVPLCDAANEAATEYLHRLQLGANFNDEILPKFTTERDEEMQYSELQGENVWKLEVPDLDDDSGLWPGITLESATVPYIAAAINEWYNSGKSWHNPPARPGVIDPTLPFTQIVWSATFSVGCGYDRDDTMVVIVCRYYPRIFFGKLDADLISLYVPPRMYAADAAKPFFQDFSVAAASPPENSDWYEGAMKDSDARDLEKPIFGGGIGNLVPKPIFGGGIGNMVPKPIKGGGIGNMVPKPIKGGGIGNMVPKPIKGGGIGNMKLKPSNARIVGDMELKPNLSSGVSDMELNPNSDE